MVLFPSVFFLERFTVSWLFLTPPDLDFLLRTLLRRQCLDFPFFSARQADGLFLLPFRFPSFRPLSSGSQRLPLDFLFNDRPVLHSRTLKTFFFPFLSLSAPDAFCDVIDLFLPGMIFPPLFEFRPRSNLGLKPTKDPPLSLIGSSYSPRLCSFSPRRLPSRDPPNLLFLAHALAPAPPPPLSRA